MTFITEATTNGALTDEAIDALARVLIELAEDEESDQ